MLSNLGSAQIALAWSILKTKPDAMSLEGLDSLFCG